MRTARSVHCHMSVSHLQAPLNPRVLVRSKPRFSASRLSFLALQHSPDAFTLLFTLFRKRLKDRFLVPQKSHPQGLATLSVVSAHTSPEAYFSSPHSWASPSKLFSNPGSARSFRIAPFVPALSLKTFPAFSRRSDDLLPEVSCVPFCLLKD